MPEMLHPFALGAVACMSSSPINILGASLQPLEQDFFQARLAHIPVLKRARWSGRATTGRRRSAPTALTPQQTCIFPTATHPCSTSPTRQVQPFCARRARSDDKTGVHRSQHCRRRLGWPCPRSDPRGRVARLPRHARRAARTRCRNEGPEGHRCRCRILQGYLRWRRTILINICSALGAEQPAARPPTSSALSLQSLPTPALDRHYAAAVWALRLHGEPGGPTSPAGTARSASEIFYIVTTFLRHTESWNHGRSSFCITDVADVKSGGRAPNPGLGASPPAALPPNDLGLGAVTGVADRAQVPCGAATSRPPGVNLSRRSVPRGRCLPNMCSKILEMM